MMTITDMEAAITAAKCDLNRADAVATSMARVLLGRMRKVESPWVLSDLKRELSKFNLKTKRWAQ